VKSQTLKRLQDNGFQLLTLGRLALLRRSHGGEDLGIHRQKLALLAVLALSDRALSRDLLTEMFWGDQPEERARHSLSNALSSLRRVLGRQAIRPHRDEVGVEAGGSLEVDAIRFEELVESGLWRDALALYRGPFLDGVGVGGASTGFEQWIDGMRARMEALFLQACATGCAAFREGGRWGEMADLARRWLAAAPLSTEAALAVLHALTAEGTRDADQRALEEFDRLSTRLGEEYGRRPDREVIARAREVVARLRLSDATGEFVVPGSLLGGDPSPAEAVAAAPAVEVDAASAAAMADRSHPVPTPASEATVGGARRAPLRRAIGVLAIGALAVLGWPLLARRPGPVSGNAAGAAARPAVAIGAIRSAADSGAAWLGEGIQQMVGARLARSSGVDVIAPERMRELLPQAATLSHLLEAGRRAGARLAVSGVVTRSEGGLMMDVNVHEVTSGALVSLTTVSAPDPIALADLVAVRVLVAAGTSPDGPSLAEVETANPQAYEQFIRFMLALDQDRGADAVAALDAAIALDSGFVSAVRERASWAFASRHYEVMPRLLEAFRRHEARATEFDRLYLASQMAFYGGEHERSEALARQLVERYPRDPRSYAWLDQVYAHHGKLAEAEDAMLRLLALDSLATRSGAGLCVPCRAYGRLVDLRHARGNLEGAEHAARALTRIAPELPRGWVQLAMIQSAQGRHADALAAAERGRLADAAGHTWVRLYGMVLIQARAWRSADSFVQALRSEADPGLLATALDLAATLARERGRHAEAVALFDTLRAHSGDGLDIVAATSLARLGRYTEAIRRFDTPAPEPHPPQALNVRTGQVGDRARSFSWHRALEADAIAPSGDTARLRAIADSLERLSGLSYYGRDWRLHHHVRGLLLALEGRHEEAAAAFQAARFTALGWSRSLAEQGRSLLALGRADEAVAALRQAYVVPLEAMGRYQTRTELDELMARAFARAGRPDSAAVYERHVREALGRR